MNQITHHIVTITILLISALPSRGEEKLYKDSNKYVILAAVKENNFSPTAKQLRMLALASFKTYACIAFVNHFAQIRHQVSEFIIPKVQKISVDNDVHESMTYGNMLHGNLCGSVIYSSRVGAKPADDLAELNAEIFKYSEGHFSFEAYRVADFFLTVPNEAPEPSFDGIEEKIRLFQGDFSTRYIGFSKSEHFLNRLKEAGNDISVTLPETTRPNVNLLEDQYPEAYTSYTQFIAWLQRNITNKTVQP